MTLDRTAPSQQIAPSLLHHLPPQNKLPPNSYTILTPPPLSAQLLAHFIPSEQINPKSYAT